MFSKLLDEITVCICQCLMPSNIAKWSNDFSEKHLFVLLPRMPRVLAELLLIFKFIFSKVFEKLSLLICAFLSLCHCRYFHAFHLVRKSIYFYRNISCFMVYLTKRANSFERKDIWKLEAEICRYISDKTHWRFLRIENVNMPKSDFVKYDLSKIHFVIMLMNAFFDKLQNRQWVLSLLYLHERKNEESLRKIQIYHFQFFF